MSHSDEDSESWDDFYAQLSGQLDADTESNKVRLRTALDSFVGSKERKQEVFTPLKFLEPLIEVWGHIALDPCGHVEAPITISGMAFETWTADGLIKPWQDKTFWNPPFKNLKAWIQHASKQRLDLLNTCGLVPVRTRSAWMRKARRDCFAVVDLNRVTFHGFKGSYPESLCLLIDGPLAGRVADAYERAGLGERTYFR